MRESSVLCLSALEFLMSIMLSRFVFPMRLFRRGTELHWRNGVHPSSHLWLQFFSYPELVQKLQWRLSVCPHRLSLPAHTPYLQT